MMGPSNFDVKLILNRCEELRPPRIDEMAALGKDFFIFTIKE